MNVIEGIGEERKIGEKTQRKMKVVQENCGIIEETKIKRIQSSKTKRWQVKASKSRMQCL